MTIWPDGTRIRLVLRPKKESDTKLIESLSPAMEQAVSSAMSRGGMILAVTDQECADAVEKIPGALGGSTLTQVLTEKRRVKVLRFKGVKPGVAGIRDGSYPLVKTLYLVTTPRTPAAARQFIEFIRSRRGASVLTTYGNLAVEAGQGKSLE
jgi:phosphate transport system substrate-binding protein